MFKSSFLMTQGGSLQVLINSINTDNGVPTLPFGIKGGGCSSGSSLRSFSENSKFVLAKECSFFSCLVLYSWYCLVSEIREILVNVNPSENL